MKNLKYIVFIFLNMIFLNLFSATDYHDSVLVVKFKPNSEYFHKWQLNNRVGEISDLNKYIGNHNSSAYITDDLLKLINKKANPGNLFINSNQNKFGLDRIAIINLNSNSNPILIAKKISSIDDIEYAEPMFKHHIDFKPNDTAYYMQHYIWQTFTHKAWDIMDTTGKPTLIAIVDTGIWYHHPDLEANIWNNEGESGLDSLGNDKSANGIDDDQNGFIDDWRGWDFGGIDNQSGQDNDPQPGHSHGTHCAGIAAAVANNIEGIVGVSFKSKLLPVKIAYDNPFTTSLVNGYKGVVYAAAMGADVINCSWGSSGFSQAEQDIINQVVELGSVVVAAAGNDYSNLPYYPAGYEGVASVAAVHWNDKKANFSNYHHTVDVSAPGTSIYSTIPHSLYTAWDGTSMASPIVAGIAAMARKKYPSYSNLKIIELLKATCDNIDSLNPDYLGALGRGRINAFRTLTDSNPRSISIVNYTLKDENNNGMFESNEKIKIFFKIKNTLNPINNVKLNYEKSNLPQLSLINSEIFAGNFVEDEVKEPTESIEIQLPSIIPYNYNLQIEVSVVDNSDFKIYTNVNLTINPSYRTISANNIQTTITSQGNIGYNDFSDNQQGIGFSYKGSSNILFEGALMIASSENRIADVARGASSVYGRKEFEIDSIIQSINPGSIAQQETFTKFFTRLDTLLPQMNITHRVFQFNEKDYTDIIFSQYDIINKTDSYIDSLFTALFFDWDIGPSGADNVAKWDSVDNFAVMQNIVDNTLPLAGVSIMSENKLNFFAIDNDGRTSDNPGIYDSFTKKEKWLMMSNGIKRAESSSTDASMVISAGPERMRAGDTLRFTFAIFAGNSISELKISNNNAKKAASKYLNFNGNFSSKPNHPVIQSIYPNPSIRGEVSILFGINKTENATLEVFDITGKKVKSIFENKQFDSGYHILKFNNDNFASGKYYVSLRNEIGNSGFWIIVQE